MIRRIPFVACASRFSESTRSKRYYWPGNNRPSSGDERPRRWRENGEVVSQKKIKDNKPLRNKRIPFKNVWVVDPLSSDTVSDSPVNLAALLNSLDLTSYFVEQVSGEPQPTVRIIRGEEKSPEDTDGPRTPREIQLTWGMSSFDLNHKLAKAQSFLLQEQRAVQLVITLNKKSTVLTPALKQEMLGQITSTLKDASKDCKELAQSTHTHVVVLAIPRPSP
jgi:translation initiation factor IF-3